MTLETICHEATHQLAFNTGLHQRLAMTPLWVAEGLATMFESPRLSGLKAREGGPLLPDSRRQEWQDLSKDHDRIFRLVEQLVRSDSEFEKHPQQAYCVSWAMTTYLSQRRPQPFSQYLSCVAGLPPFEKYVATQRIDGFGQAFGLDHQILVKNMIAYIDSLE